MNRNSSSHSSSFGRRSRRSGSSRSRGRVMQTQTQALAQNTEQLQSQMVFLEQVKATLDVAHVHLEAVAKGAPVESLSSSASGLVAVLNLARQTALERQDDRQGLDAAKAAVAKFREQVRSKYGGLPSAETRGRIAEVQGAVCSHLVSVLDGYSDVPVMGVAPFIPSDRRSAQESVRAGMAEFMRGGHRLEDLRADVAKNSSRYRRELEAEARAGAESGMREERGAFSARGGVGILQADMTSVGVVRDPRELERQSQRELDAIVARNKASEEMSFGSYDGAPDLTGARCAGHARDEDGDLAMGDSHARGPWWR